MGIVLHLRDYERKPRQKPEAQVPAEVVALLRGFALDASYVLDYSTLIDTAPCEMPVA